MSVSDHHRVILKLISYMKRCRQRCFVFGENSCSAKHSVIFLLFGVYKPWILLTTLSTSGRQIMTERNKMCVYILTLFL